MKRILVGLPLIGLLLALSVSAVAAQEVTHEAAQNATTITLDSKASTVRLSPDDHTLAAFNNAVLYDEPPSAELIPITLIDLATGETTGTLSGYSDWVMDAAFSSDGKTLASIHRNGDLILWDVASMKMIRTITTPALGGSPIQFFNDNKTIVLHVGEFWLGTIDTESGAITHLFGRHIDSYNDFSENYTQYPKRGDISFASFAASPDGHWLAASTQNDEVLVWDMQTGELVTLRPPSDKFGLFSIRAFVFSSDSSQLIYFDQGDDQTHVWDIASQKELSTFAGGGFSFALAPDGKTIAWADRASNTVYLADLTNSDAPTTLITLPETQRIAPQVTSLAFTSDGKQLVLGGLFADEGENKIYVFNLAE